MFLLLQYMRQHPEGSRGGAFELAGAGWEPRAAAMQLELVQRWEGRKAWAGKGLQPIRVLHKSLGCDGAAGLPRRFSEQTGARAGAEIAEATALR